MSPSFPYVPPAMLRNSVPSTVTRGIGIVILVGAIGLLSWNERRITLPFFATRAIPVQANAPERIETLRSVAATGLLTAPSDIGDPPYLSPGPFIAIKRTVEMYAWSERFPGSSRIPVYERVWTESPQDSSHFAEPNGHENPTKSLASKLHRVSTAHVGIFDVDISRMILPPFRPLELSAAIVHVSNGSLHDNVIFRGTGTVDAPNIGDLRIAYSVLPQSQTVTLFAGIDGRRLIPYRHPNDFLSYHLFYGDRAAALQRIGAQSDRLLWPLRVIGSILVWLALSLLTPFGSMARRWECIAQLRRPLLPLLLFPIAIIVSAILILLLDTLFSMWIAIAAAAALVLSFFLIEQRLLREASPAQSNAPVPALPTTVPSPQLPTPPVLQPPPPPNVGEITSSPQPPIPPTVPAATPKRAATITKKKAPRRTSVQKKVQQQRTSSKKRISARRVSPVKRKSAKRTSST